MKVKSFLERSMNFVHSQDSDTHSHFQESGGPSEKLDIWRDSRSLDSKSTRTGVTAWFKSESMKWDRQHFEPDSMMCICGGCHSSFWKLLDPRQSQNYCLKQLGRDPASGRVTEDSVIFKELQVAFGCLYRDRWLLCCEIRAVPVSFYQLLRNTPSSYPSGKLSGGNWKGSVE